LRLEQLENRQLLAAVVGIVATDAWATERNAGREADPGKFTLTRSGSLDGALTVKYSIAGTATNGVDYTQIASTTTIPSGSASVVITIAPINDTTVEGTESVVLHLTATDGYSVSSEHPEAAVNIHDNDGLPVVSIVASDATAAETNSGQEANPGKFTVSRTGSLDAPLIVKYTIGGTAGNGVDYGQIGTAVTIPAGAASTAVTIAPINDTAVEGTETAILHLASADAYTVNSEHPQAVVNILDNDAAPASVSIVATDAWATERNDGQEPDPGKFTITRTGSLDGALTVLYTIGGTATNGVDYTQIGASAVIPAGQSSVVVTIAPINDTTVEATESVVLHLTASDGYVVNSEHPEATVNIHDNDGLPVISITATDATAAETNDGQEANPGTFTITRTGSTDAMLLVKCTIGGTATNGTDYEQIYTTATIPPGSSSVVVTIAPINDTTVEGTETAILKLAPADAYTINSEHVQAAVNILDNDAAPPSVSLVATDAWATERNDGQEADPGKFTITRTGSLDAALTVNYTISGTAANGVDYTQLGGSAVIPAGSASVVVTVAVINDTAIEQTESVVLHLTASDVYTVNGEHPEAAVNIHDNDGLPVVSIVATDAEAAETNEGQTANPGKFTIARTGSLDAALTVKYTIGGTATNGSDYGQTGTVVTIPAGQASLVVTIAPINDTVVEGTETVVLHLTATDGYTVGADHPEATVNILDNDTATLPTVSIAVNDAEAAETNDGQTANPGQFTITRTGSLDQALTVVISRTGTATNGTDYQTIGETVVIAAGSSTAVVNLLVINDTIHEDTETAEFVIQSSANYSIDTAHDSALISIVDNDPA
jgi:hypothetical protein